MNLTILYITTLIALDENHDKFQEGDDAHAEQENPQLDGQSYPDDLPEPLPAVYFAAATAGS